MTLSSTKIKQSLSASCLQKVCLKRMFSLLRGCFEIASSAYAFEQSNTMLDTGDFPHILFYGPPGAGKKTLMKAMLRDFYGAGVTKVKVETKPWKIELPSRKLEIELMTLSSNFHVEMNPSDVGNNDR